MYSVDLWGVICIAQFGSSRGRRRMSDLHLMTLQPRRIDVASEDDGRLYADAVHDSSCRLDFVCDDSKRVANIRCTPRLFLILTLNNTSTKDVARLKFKTRQPPLPSHPPPSSSFLPSPPLPFPSFPFRFTS